jgi:tRNA(Ile)-lysidine synthase
MASTRKRRRADGASADLLPGVRSQLVAALPTGSRILVGLSGGVDSVVLLDLLRRAAPRRRWRLSALHVNHQLQPPAAEWATFCRRICRTAGIPLRVAKVDVPPGDSREGAARSARYGALLRQPADYIALAHSEDDQAETVLMHLLRGSGIRGLAGMQRLGDPPSRTLAAQTRRRPRILRPLLDVPRSAIMAYAEQRNLEWIEDPSNADVQYTRNFIRRKILPAVAERFPACREALARGARHAAEAVLLLDELALLDGAPPGGREPLALARLRALSPPRAKNVLRHYLHCQGIDIPSSERLEEAIRQILAAREDARICVSMGDTALRVHRGTVVLAPVATPGAAMQRAWRGEEELALPELGGRLRMERARGRGISAALLAAAPVTVRARRGGERLRPAPGGASRTVKNLMQEARMPPWERERVPFIYCGETLVCVPGIGIDSRFCAGPREPGILPVWRKP